ncbi:carotenoid oxygenase family protein [Halomicronema sp. CCY15110]|uniref:carotenoid oxygenase family protein n=1 Tax=Halomicronema sp. CCY15110 TaxID=2767773 RepID=UPI00195207BE|nr:carotenoid oxygenase family protein [Halomicronema sp. CCY15110]
MPAPSFPKAAMTADRTDHIGDTVLTLHCIEGTVPTDWYGSSFFIAPVGTVASDGLPNPNGTHIFNSDGMVYRLDLGAGEVKAANRLMRTPCHYADRATFDDPVFQPYQFRDYGMLRFSFALGLRDEVDIAFLPFKAAGEEQDRLLVTYEAGRPYEIDTHSLEVVTPVGQQQHWKAFLPMDYPFAPLMTTSHPAYDGYTHEVFMVNYGRSLNNFLESARFVYGLEGLPQEVEQVLHHLTEILNAPLLKGPLASLVSLTEGISQHLWDWLSHRLGEVLPNFTYLVSWDGQGDIQRWQLMQPDGTPVRIEQSLHQVGVTQDYVVLMDTSLKIGPEQILNNPVPDSPETERLLRQTLTRPQQPDSPTYIVKRADLAATATPNADGTIPTVTAQFCRIPMEIVHYLVDYDNPHGEITLHAAHLAATDIGEWLHDFDVFKFDPPHGPPAWLRGMIANGQMDIGRVARYRIDGDTGRLTDAKITYDSKRHWGIGFYAYQERTAEGMPPRQLKKLYWQSLGFWPELLTEFVYDLYADYPYRAIALSELLDQEADRPSSLFQVDAATLDITSAYDAPPGYFLSSPQFVPRQNGDDSGEDGYIICTAFGTDPQAEQAVNRDRKEIWVFRADDIAAGPLCKLSHPEFQFGFTMHTDWLPAIAPRTATYHVPVRQDYDPLLTQPEIRRLFHEQVYPHFETSST